MNTASPIRRIAMLMLIALGCIGQGTCYVPSLTSCTSCANTCMGTWYANSTSNALIIPDDEWMQIPACRSWDTPHVYWCNSTPPWNYVPSGCSVDGSPGICCFHEIQDLGTENPVNYLIQVPKGGGYRRCFEPEL